MLIPMAFCLVVMTFAFKRVINVSNACRRLDSVYRGPLSSNFTNVVSGLVTLRTFDRLKYFQYKFIDDLNKSCNCTFSMQSLQRHLITQLDLICVFITITSATYTILQKSPEADKKTLSFQL